MLDREELKSLVKAEALPSVSIYTPTAKAGKATLDNPYRLRLLLQQAKDSLQKDGMGAREAEAILDPAQELLGDYPFWQLQDHGLALFLAPGFFAGYQTPYPVPSRSYVADGFHFKPLLPLLADDGQFFILALSKNEVKLYQASRYDIQVVPLENVVRSEAEALRFDDPEKNLQVHTAVSGNVGAVRTGIIHGHGAAKDAAKDQTLRYFRSINAGLRRYLRDQRAPLLLAGVAYYLPIYREANTYPFLLDEPLPGNPEATPPDRLRDAAWEIVGPLFQKARAQARGEIQEGLAKRQAVDDLQTAVAAACSGRAGKCIVALDEEHWGRVDPETMAVQTVPPSNPRARDLLDIAATRTILQGGEVFPVPNAAEVPGAGPLAVLLRHIG